jgi:hypothetical protein
MTEETKDDAEAMPPFGRVAIHLYNQETSLSVGQFAYNYVNNYEHLPVHLMTTFMMLAAGTWP